MDGFGSTSWTIDSTVGLDPQSAYRLVACNGTPQRDGVVYFCLCINEVDIRKTQSPFDVDRPIKWSAHHSNPRLAAQDGLFTLSPDPTKVFRTGITYVVRVKSIAKSRIIESLTRYGIHPGSVFPGLDVAAAYVESQARSLHGIKDWEALNRSLTNEIKKRSEAGED